MNPCLAWLAARLAKQAAPAREVTDEALSLGITQAELDEAKTALRVKADLKIVNGSAYSTWELPPRSSQYQPGYDPRRYVTPAKEEPPAIVAPSRAQKPDPKQRVEAAKKRLQRHSLRNARYLEELTERAARDSEKCPTCKRGMPRAEETRLRAILAALDKAGVGNPKEAQDETDYGPAIVFPPGTRIAVMAETPQPTAPPLRVERGE